MVADFSNYILTSQLSNLKKSDKAGKSNFILLNL
jgi:hypothetical protein